MLTEMVFMVIWEVLPLENIFKLSASAASEFCEWVQVGIDVYIHCKYKVKSHLSQWFLPACPVAIALGNYFYRLYQQNNFSESKDIQASNHFKRAPEVAKFAYANKTKKPNMSQKHCCKDFSRIVNSVLNKGKSAIPPQFVLWSYFLWGCSESL